MTTIRQINWGLLGGMALSIAAWCGIVFLAWMIAG
jgi:hypothetical protein